jgi:hypothetical protein
VRKVLLKFKNKLIMVQKKSLKLTTKRETIYGWYPSSQNDTSIGDPKEIYTNLGSRPPKKETYHS